MRVVSFNIRGDFPSDGADNWQHRRGFLVEVVRAIGPDLLATQEVLAHQGDFLREQLAEYGSVGTGRDDNAREGEACTIFYRTERFERLDAGQFWLSPTPTKVGSVGWDARLTRIMTWAKLRDREANGATLLIANAHFDHLGELARKQSAKLMRRLIGELGSEVGNSAAIPTLVAGDFNCTELDPPYAAMTADRAFRDTYRAIHPTPGPEDGSFHGFTGTRTGHRIDWILCSSHWTPRAASIDRTTRDGRYPSDHFPVVADVELAS